MQMQFTTDGMHFEIVMLGMNFAPMLREREGVSNAQGLSFEPVLFDKLIGSPVVHLLRLLPHSSASVLVLALLLLLLLHVQVSTGSSTARQHAAAWRLMPQLSSRTTAVQCDIQGSAYILIAGLAVQARGSVSHLGVWRDCLPKQYSQGASKEACGMWASSGRRVQAAVGFDREHPFQSSLVLGVTARAECSYCACR